MSVRLNYETCEKCSKKKTCPVRVPGGCRLFQDEKGSDSDPRSGDGTEHEKFFGENKTKQKP